MLTSQHSALSSILQVLANHPALVVDHAQAYAGLLASETQAVGKHYQRQTVLLAVAIASLCVGAVLIGVAWMLFASGTPAWAVLTAPLPALLVGAWCLYKAREPSPSVPFDELKRQWAADWAILQETLAS